MMRGSQTREMLNDSEYELVKLTGKPGSREAILQDKELNKLELWIENDHVVGYCIEINGKGFEFVSSSPKHYPQLKD